MSDVPEHIAALAEMVKFTKNGLSEIDSNTDLKSKVGGISQSNTIQAERLIKGALRNGVPNAEYGDGGSFPEDGNEHAYVEQFAGETPYDGSMDGLEDIQVEQVNMASPQQPRRITANPQVFGGVPQGFPPQQPTPPQGGGFPPNLMAAILRKLSSLENSNIKLASNIEKLELVIKNLDKKM